MRAKTGFTITPTGRRGLLSPGDSVAQPRHRRRPSYAQDTAGFITAFYMLRHRTVLHFIHAIWLSEDRPLLSRMYVRRVRVFWHEEIAQLAS